MYIYIKHADNNLDTKDNNKALLPPLKNKILAPSFPPFPSQNINQTNVQ